jgi:hypothetical protein
LDFALERSRWLIVLGPVLLPVNIYSINPGNKTLCRRLDGCNKGRWTCFFILRAYGRDTCCWHILRVRLETAHLTFLLVSLSEKLSIGQSVMAFSTEVVMTKVTLGSSNSAQSNSLLDGGLGPSIQGLSA